MGILNVTPDSFSDGGRFVDPDQALDQAMHMVESGADILDIGGESTRPGADDVSAEVEIDRVLPVIERISQRSDVIVSIDTSKPSVMRAAAAAGAGLINDVRALREPGALDAAVSLSLPVCLMHMQGRPRSMQNQPSYQNVVHEVYEFLQQRLSECVSAGLCIENLLIDPGFGFGKTTAHNLRLLERLNEFATLAPIVTGLSRKRMFAEILGSDAADRTTASVAAALFCVQHGSSIVRVHDVRQTVEALQVYNALETSRCNAG